MPLREARSERRETRNQTIYSLLIKLLLPQQGVGWVRCRVGRQGSACAGRSGCLSWRYTSEIVSCWAAGCARLINTRVTVRSRSRGAGVASSVSANRCLATRWLTGQCTWIGWQLCCLIDLSSSCQRACSRNGWQAWIRGAWGRCVC